jgi:hypothetical protein
MTRRASACPPADDLHRAALERAVQSAGRPVAGPRPHFRPDVKALLFDKGQRIPYYLGDWVVSRSYPNRLPLDQGREKINVDERLASGDIHSLRRLAAHLIEPALTQKEVTEEDQAVKKMGGAAERILQIIE